jgi:glutamate-1-semialdehyde 2,1-aminomutase
VTQRLPTVASDTYGNRYLESGSRSAELYARARAVMPGGNTRTTVFAPPYPAYVASAQGASVTDVEGQTRLDFVNNYTALIHGHAHPRIIDAVGQQLRLGTAVSFPTESEVRLAELLVERVDSIEHIRFTNSGTEAVMMAIQAARAFTGRPRIAKFEGCYHGAYDYAEISVGPSVSLAGPARTPRSIPESAGVSPAAVDEVVVLPFNDPDAVERIVTQHARDLAAVMVDPLPHRSGFLDPNDAFLPRLRQITREHKVLLISDEIISFRLGYHGPQHRFGYDADLTTLGKIIGGGFPVGAFGGRADIMAVFDPGTSGTRVAHRGTFNANPVSMRAGYEAMAMMTPSEYDRLAALGQRVRSGLADVIETRGVSWQVAGQGSLFKLHPHPRALVDYRSTLPTPAEQASAEQFYLAMLGHGFVLMPELAGALSTPMSEREVDQLIDAADRVFGLLQQEREALV